MTTTARLDLGRFAADGPPALFRDHDPVMELRIGADLTITVCAGVDPDHPHKPAGGRWYVLAFDNDGNYLSTLAALRTPGVPDAVLTAAIDTARQLYPGLARGRTV